MKPIAIAVLASILIWSPIAAFAKSCTATADETHQRDGDNAHAFKIIFTANSDDCVEGACNGQIYFKTLYHCTSGGEGQETPQTFSNYSIARNSSQTDAVYSHYVNNCYGAGVQAELDAVIITNVTCDTY